MRTRTTRSSFLALGLATLAVSGTLANLSLAWLRYCILWNRPLPAPLNSLPNVVLRLAYEDGLFHRMVALLLVGVLVCCCGALWLALRSPRR